MSVEDGEDGRFFEGGRSGNPGLIVFKISEFAVDNTRNMADLRILATNAIESC